MVLLFCCIGVEARKPPAPKEELSPALQQVVDRAIAREHELLASLKSYTPLAETYIQDLRPDKELGFVPTGDHYFLVQLDLRQGLSERSFMKQPFRLTRLLRRASISKIDFNALGVVAQPLIIDRTGFDRQHYSFAFVGREFLGDVRALLFDVSPKRHSGNGRFVGRIWIEDLDYNIVRFNGTYAGAPIFSTYLHLDSWRTNVQPQVWLPSYVYLEESDLRSGFGRVHLKGVTTVWGYGLKKQHKQDELTDVLVDSTVKDRSESAQDYSPVQRQRLWERQAEDNVIERLQKSGLMAPDGEVDRVLETVINNLEITNNLNIQPEVRARVLLTSQLESFTIGHTIVLSRGLLDVLPDEASLAMALAHELAHISLGHRLDTKYAFSDRMLFEDQESFRRFQLHRDNAEEDAADRQALAFLQKSPYADKLSNAGLFLRALGTEGPQLSSLLSPHYGNRLTRGRELMRMAELMRGAPQLQAARVEQIAALPLGSRIKVDPWDGRIEMMKTTAVPLLSAREKMAFEVTPVIQNLKRKPRPPEEAMQSRSK